MAASFPETCRPIIRFVLNHNETGAPRCSEESYLGAGVVFYFKKNEEVWFIFGVETNGSSNNQAEGTSSDFGGRRVTYHSKRSKNKGSDWTTITKRKKTGNREVDPIFTASREAFEEARSIFGTKKEIEEALKTAAFIERNRYFTYFLEIEPLSEDDFNALRGRFMAQENLSPEYLEKSDLILVAAINIFQAIRNAKKTGPDWQHKVYFQDAEERDQRLRGCLAITFDQSKAVLQQILTV